MRTQHVIQKVEPTKKRTPAAIDEHTEVNTTLQSGAVHDTQLSCHVVNSSRSYPLQVYRSVYTRNMPLALVHKEDEA
jgi:hypothetical protein